MLLRLTSSVKCHEILIKTFIHRKIGIRLLLRKFRKITNKPYFVLCQPTLVKIGRNLCYTQTWMETSYFEVVTVKNCWHYKPSLASFKKCQNKSSKLFWKVSSALISSWHIWILLAQFQEQRRRRKMSRKVKVQFSSDAKILHILGPSIQNSLDIGVTYLKKASWHFWEEY